MHIETSGTARIRDGVSGQIFEVESDLLEWDTASSDDEPMGDRVQWRAEVEHTVLGTLAWILWEYPTGFTDYTDQELNGHDLIQNFEIRLVHDQDNGDFDEDDGRPDIEWADMPFNDQVERMVVWFNTYYEDPQNEMPYADKESGDNYDYIWGGPYDAEDELSAEFEGRASDAAIKKAVSTVTGDGTFDWAPTSEHPRRQKLESGNYEDLDGFDDDEDSEDDEDFELVAIPTQLLSPLMTYEQDDRVARLPHDAFEPVSPVLTKIRISSHAAIIEALFDFNDSFPAHNHPALKKTLERLGASLGAEYTDLDVIRLGSAAERLNQYALRADDIFVPEMAADVVALNINIIANLSRFPEWNDYRQGLEADPEATDAALESAHQVVTALVQADLLEPEVKDELEAEMIPFIVPLEGYYGNAIERKTFFRSLSNVLSTTASIALKHLSKTGDKLLEGHFEGVKKIGEHATVLMFTGSVTALTALAATHGLFAFLVPFLKFLIEAAGAK